MGRLTQILSANPTTWLFLLSCGHPRRVWGHSSGLSPPTARKNVLGTRPSVPKPPSPCKIWLPLRSSTQWGQRDEGYSSSSVSLFSSSIPFQNIFPRPVREKDLILSYSLVSKMQPRLGLKWQTGESCSCERSCTGAQHLSTCCLWAACTVWGWVTGLRSLALYKKFANLCSRPWILSAWHQMFKAKLFESKEIYPSPTPILLLGSCY